MSSFALRSEYVLARAEVEKNQRSDLLKILNKISCLFNPKLLNAISSLHKLLNEISSLLNPKILNDILSLSKLLNEISEHDLGLQNSIWDYPPNQQAELHQVYINLGSYQLILLSEAPPSPHYIDKNG
ncbi:hypothetical protein PVK06_040747 [Gossypium arboreum]|uniref:Uncharacterized protein n=1 Tax=Gossypium arboreum TaxID=29729 RepID=A0ABR0N8I1_GOSAR|nr:hypothetical protein PVK06_040747 [Gossypium arboreum]